MNTLIIDFYEREISWLLGNYIAIGMSKHLLLCMIFGDLIFIFLHCNLFLEFLDLSEIIPRRTRAVSCIS